MRAGRRLCCETVSFDIGPPTLATTPTIDSPRLTQSATGFALRSGCAAAACLVLSEGFHLAHADLAVWTTHMVMSQFAFTSFQKGVERVAGRGLGIVAGLVLLALFRNSVYLGFAFECLALLVFFYVYFCNRLAYTFLNAGLYLAVIMQVGRAEPLAAAPEGGQMFLAIVVGVVVADLVSWFSGAERDLSIQTGGEPFFPIDRGRLGQCVVLVVTVALSQLIVAYFDLPANATLVSVMMLTIVPDLHQLLRKGELRMLGALLAMAYAFGSFVLLVRLQHFPLLVALLFVGSYLATYLARAGGDWAYAGVQMGLVLPMILVVPAREFGTMTAAIARLQGVVIALGCAIFVGAIVAAFARTALAATRK
jgi:Fusaric acid resistance protein-like